jgi:hypothetical protein
MLDPLDVILIFDGLIEPPHPKMVVCVQPEEGWFYRINSRPFLKPCLPLMKLPDHPWLDHDSFLHIDILMLDDYIVEASQRHHRQGVSDPEPRDKALDAEHPLRLTGGQAVDLPRTPGLIVGERLLTRPLSAYILSRRSGLRVHRTSSIFQAAVRRCR